MIVSLIRYCSNLRFMVNECYTDMEKHTAGPIILQSVADSCPRLKRLHWKPRGITQLLSSSWSPILASSSLATSLEVLEIKSCLPAAANASIPAPTLQLELPSLHCLQVCVNNFNVSLTSAIAEEWQLPSLKSLYIYQSIYTFRTNSQLARTISSLISTHGHSLATLMIDRNAACRIPLHILPPAPIQELVYYVYGLQKATLLVSFTALPTLVLLIDMEDACPGTTAIRRASEQLHILRDYSLPKLKKVVVLSGPLDKLKEPHPINVRLLDDTERLWVEPWLQETPRLVSRNGERPFMPVVMEQD